MTTITDDFSRYGALPAPCWASVTVPAPAPSDMPLTELKKIANSMREASAAKELEPFASQLTIQHHTFPTPDDGTGVVSLSARSYRPKDVPAEEQLPAYMHFHGGGFLMGTSGTDANVSARISLGARCVVVDADYRHTPEHVYPAAWHDAIAALSFLFSNATLLSIDPAKIVVGGISAGANLAASLVVARHLGLPEAKGLEGFPRLAGQVLMIPNVTHMDEKCRLRVDGEEEDSFVQCKEPPVLPVKRVVFFQELLKVEDPDPTDYLLNPGLVEAEKVGGMPPSVFGVAGMDPLRDQGLLWGRRLAENGVPTDVHIFPGLPHGFSMFLKEGEPELKRWYDVMVEGVKWAVSKPTATGKFEIQEPES